MFNVLGRAAIYISEQVACILHKAYENLFLTNAMKWAYFNAES